MSNSNDLDHLIARLVSYGPYESTQLQGMADLMSEAADALEALRKELAAALKPPPCQHSRQSGWVKGSRWEMKCDQCGLDMQSYMMALK